MLSRHFTGVVEQLLADGTTYADLSVEAIITTGGIARSTFYVYFTDKGDLLAAMAQEVIGDLVQDGTSWWKLPADATREDLHRALRVPIEAYRRHRTILGLVAEMSAHDARVREQQRSLIDRVVESLTGYIVEAQQAGTVDADLDAPHTAQWLIWMIERGLYQLVDRADSRETEQSLDALTEIVWRVIYR